MSERERGRCFTFNVSVFLSFGAAYWQTVTEIERPLGGLADPPLDLQADVFALGGEPLLNRSLASFVPVRQASSFVNRPLLP